MKAFQILTQTLASTSATAINRRNGLLQTSALLKKLALAALPVSLVSAMPKSTATTQTDVSVFNFLLLIKKMQQELYSLGLQAAAPGGTFTESSAGIANASLYNALNKLLEQEQIQTASLQNLVTEAGLTPVAATFNFTGGIAPNDLTDTFRNKDLFMSIAQVLEDTSAAVVLGQLENFKDSLAHLIVLLQLQSTESRHATLWREARALATASISIYPTANTVDAALNNALVNYANAQGVNIPATIYQAQNNTTQLSTNVSTTTAEPATAVALAFDEPISQTDAQAVIDLFIS